jgi:RimJ/RimL family protein N-acetyltransferase
MKLEWITKNDYSLFESIFSDQKMMAQLGGPLNPEQIKSLHERSVTSIASGKAWHFKIFDTSTTVSVGIVGIWEKQYAAANINEIGWMILPGFQGRGAATWGATQVIAKAKKEAKFEEVHAFPPTTNVPSNIICEKLGFRKVKEVNFDYQGRSLRCLHWVLDLTE